jgi:hypothetical protein
MPAGHSRQNCPTGTRYYFVKTSLPFNFNRTPTAAPLINTNPEDLNPNNYLAI